MKHIALINPKTVNKYYHLNLGGIDRLFAWFFRKFYDKKFEIPTHNYGTCVFKCDHCRIRFMRYQHAPTLGVPSSVIGQGADRMPSA